MVRGTLRGEFGKEASAASEAGHRGRAGEEEQECGEETGGQVDGSRKGRSGIGEAI